MGLHVLEKKAVCAHPETEESMAGVSVEVECLAVSEGGCERRNW